MKPTHILKVLEKTTDHRTEVGVAWQNKDGSLTISLNPCIVLAPNQNHVITLFKIDDPAPPPGKKIIHDPADPCGWGKK